MARLACLTTLVALLALAVSCHALNPLFFMHTWNSEWSVLTVDPATGSATTVYNGTVPITYLMVGYRYVYFLTYEANSVYVNRINRTVYTQVDRQWFKVPGALIYHMGYDPAGNYMFFLQVGSSGQLDVNALDLDSQAILNAGYMESSVDMGFWFQYYIGKAAPLGALIWQNTNSSSTCDHGFDWFNLAIPVVQSFVCNAAAMLEMSNYRRTIMNEQLIYMSYQPGAPLNVVDIPTRKVVSTLTLKPHPAFALAADPANRLVYYIDVSNNIYSANITTSESRLVYTFTLDGVYPEFLQVAPSH